MHTRVEMPARRLQPRGAEADEGRATRCKSPPPAARTPRDDAPTEQARERSTNAAELLSLLLHSPGSPASPQQRQGLQQQQQEAPPTLRAGGASHPDATSTTEPSTTTTTNTTTKRGESDERNADGRSDIDGRRRTPQRRSSSRSRLIQAGRRSTSLHTTSASTSGSSSSTRKTGPGGDTVAAMSSSSSSFRGGPTPGSGPPPKSRSLSLRNRWPSQGGAIGGDGMVTTARADGMEWSRQSSAPGATRSGTAHLPMHMGATDEGEPSPRKGLRRAGSLPARHPRRRMSRQDALAISKHSSFV